MTATQERKILMHTEVEEALGECRLDQVSLSLGALALTYEPTMVCLADTEVSV